MDIAEINGVVYSMLISYKEYKNYSKEIEKYKEKYSDFITRNGIDVSDLGKNIHNWMIGDNLFYYNYRERNDSYKTYSILRKRILKHTNLETMVYYVENYKKKLKKEKEFKLFEKILEENYPKLSFFEKDNFMNYYVDFLGKLGNEYNPEREKARRNFRNTLKEDLKNTRLEFFRRNFNKNLQKQLNEVVYMYEFYTKTVIDEREFAELNSIFGKKYCMNLNNFILY